MSQTLQWINRFVQLPNQHLIKCEITDYSRKSRWKDTAKKKALKNWLETVTDYIDNGGGGHGYGGGGRSYGDGGGDDK